MNISKKETKSIFIKEIWDELSSTGTKQTTDKKAYVLGGQPGAGKSSLLDEALKESDNNLVVINGDEFRQYHPNFKELQEKYGIDSANHTAQFSGAITGMALEKAIKEGYNIAIEGTFRTAETPINTLKNFKDNGYKTEVMIMTCPKDVSRSSTLSRYSEMAENGELARYTPKPAHDIVVDNLPSNAQEVLESGYTDHMRVYSREALMMDTANNRDKSVSNTIETELHRGLTPVEKKEIITSYEQLAALQEKNNAPEVEKQEIRDEKADYLLRSGLSENETAIILASVKEKFIEAGISGNDLDEKMEKVQQSLEPKPEIKKEAHQERDDDLEL